jgi:hypothetical protein
MNKKRLLWLIPALLLTALALSWLRLPQSGAEPTAPEESREDAPIPTPAAASSDLSPADGSVLPTLVEEESFFSDFNVRGDRVYFLCHLCIRNPSDQPRAVRIEGDFSEDVQGGLLAENRNLYALRLEDFGPDSLPSMGDEELAAAADLSGDGRSRVFPLQPGDNHFPVLFAGDHGTAEVKQNRLLPPLTICALEDVTPPEILAETGCRIFKDPREADAFLLDGERLCELGCGLGGYGLTSAVPWDYDGNGTVDLLYTYSCSWGSGRHRSQLSLLDRTKWEERVLYLYDPSGPKAGSDLLVKHETDSAGNDSYPVYTVDVSMNAYAHGFDYTELFLEEREQIGDAFAVRRADGGAWTPLFWPASADFFPQTEDASVAASPSSCAFSLDCITLTFTGEKAAELLNLCQQAEKRAEPGDFYVPDRTMPLLRLIFTWDDGSSAFYQIDGNNLGIFGPSYANAQAVLQFPAGTYDALWAMWGEPGNPIEETEAFDLQASLRYCSVTYGGGTREVSGETAEELYRICGEAAARGENHGYKPERLVLSHPEQLELFLRFRFWSEEAESAMDGLTDGLWFAVYKDDLCFTGLSLYFSDAQELRLPAGTYDALIDVLERDGPLPAPAGERIEGNEVYALFEDKGVYAVQLYRPDGELVWACGSVNHEPLVAEEEPGLWSVSLQAGTGLSTRWTLYYAPETGTLSPSYYGVLDRQGDRLIRIRDHATLELRGLFDTGEGTILRDFSEPLSNAVEPFVSAHFTEDGRAVVVTYLAGADYHEVTETIQLP